MFWFFERFNVFELNDVHTFASRVSTCLHVFCIRVCVSVCETHIVDKHSSLCKDNNYYLLTFLLRDSMRVERLIRSVPKGIEQIDDYASREFRLVSLFFFCRVCFLSGPSHFECAAVDEIIIMNFLHGNAHAQKFNSVLL